MHNGYESLINTSLEWCQIGIRTLRITDNATICPGTYYKKHQRFTLLALCDNNPLVAGCPHKDQFITMTSEWARQRLKSPASRLFTQPIIRAQIKENIKALRHWPLCGNAPSPVNSPHKWPVTRKMFPFDDVIMQWRGKHLYGITVTFWHIHVTK